MMFQIMNRTFAFKLIITALLCSNMTILSLRVQPYRVSFVLGGPAAGKSTQCKKLVDDYGCIHLSAGDLLREERASGSSTATLIESYINEGAIVPVGITLDLIRSSMEKSKATRFLIDGFPRNEDNFLGWSQVMTEELCVLDSIFYIECPEDECKNRIIERSKTSGRSDDNLETLAKRFVTFNEITLPVIQNFEKNCPLSNSNTDKKNSRGVYRISGDRDIETVYNDMKIAYEEMVIFELMELSKKLLTAEDERNTEMCNLLISPDCTIVNSRNSQKKNHNKNAEAGISSSPSSFKPHVRVMGKSAIISYIRERASNGVVCDCEETRVWQLDDFGLWKNVHLHRVTFS